MIMIVYDVKARYKLQGVPEKYQEKHAEGRLNILIIKYYLSLSVSFSSLWACFINSSIGI